MDVLELRQKRAALVKQARDLLDRADTENRALTAEEEQQYERIMAEVDAIGKRIEMEERQKALERELSQSLGTVAARRDQPGAYEHRGGSRRATEEYRDAFWTYFRHGERLLLPDQARMLVQVRALAVGTDSAGGYLVPEEFERRLIDRLEEENVMRRLATVVTTSGDRNIPIVDTHGEAYWTGENQAFTESDDSFTKKVLGAHKLTVMMRVSEELLQDAAFDIEQYVQREFARRAGVKEEEAFVAGDGNGRPRGVVLDAQVGVTAASATAIATDELLDLYHALKRPYRARATWLMNDATVKAVRKLKDNDGQYIWAPGLQAGEPDRLLGRPVAISPAMPIIGAGNRSVLFGDFSFYWIADRAGRVFQRLSELYAANGQVGYRAWQRVDGCLVLPEAVQALAHPAS